MGEKFVTLKSSGLRERTLNIKVLSDSAKHGRENASQGGKEVCLEQVGVRVFYEDKLAVEW